MKESSLILILILSSFQCYGSDRNDLLKDLDRMIEQRQLYMDKKEHRIDSLRNFLTADLSLSERYALNHQIYKEYSTYRCDSAMRYVFDNQKIADQMGIQKYKDESFIALSMLLSTTGMFRESIENLNNINRQQLDTTLLSEYYAVTEWTYYAAGQYINDSMYAPRYAYLEGLYRDSVYQTLSPNTERYNYYKGKILMNEGQLEDALEIYLKTYPSMKVDTRLYAIITFDIATIYQRFGNMDKYEEFLIRAAISDQVNPLKENLAGQELALFLFKNKPKDLDRAYRYIQCSMEDAQFYNNRLRIVQISEKLPIIVEAYQTKIESGKKKLIFTLIGTSILSLATIILSCYLFKQIKLIRRNRRELRKLNSELNSLNGKLQDANHTREEYVGIFIDLCSTYIDKLDKYREMVKRKIVARQFDELYQTVNSTRSIEMEQSDLLQNFDTSFLKLFPTFIEDLNELLLPDEKIYPKKNENLNRELRIFALIRLGIKDSARIASFLHYSPQTVYNNRTKVRNKAKNKDGFEKEVLRIGGHHL